MRAQTFCSTKGHLPTFLRVLPLRILLEVSLRPPFSPCAREEKNITEHAFYLLPQVCNRQTLKVLNLISVYVPPNPVLLYTGIWSANPKDAYFTVSKSYSCFESREGI